MTRVETATHPAQGDGDHAGDVTEVGRVVVAAFAAGDKLPDDTYLGVCGGVCSFNDFVGTLNAQGHKLQVLQVPLAVYDGFYPVAREVREMFRYFVEHTYFGPSTSGTLRPTPSSRADSRTSPTGRVCT